MSTMDGKYDEGEWWSLSFSFYFCAHSFVHSLFPGCCAAAAAAAAAATTIRTHARKKCEQCLWWNDREWEAEEKTEESTKTHTRTRSPWWYGCGKNRRRERSCRTESPTRKKVAPVCANGFADESCVCVYAWVSLRSNVSVLMSARWSWMHTNTHERTIDAHMLSGWYGRERGIHLDRHRRLVFALLRFTFALISTSTSEQTTANTIVCTPNNLMFVSMVVQFSERQHQKQTCWFVDRVFVSIWTEHFPQSQRSFLMKRRRKKSTPTVELVRLHTTSIRRNNQRTIWFHAFKFKFSFW